MKSPAEDAASFDAVVVSADPAVIRRTMSNRKVYLYDNGFSAALQYQFSEDRGKRLENAVFRHLYERSTGVFFAKNGWECDFVAMSHGAPPPTHSGDRTG